VLTDPDRLHVLGTFLGAWWGRHRGEAVDVAKLLPLLGATRPSLLTAADPGAGLGDLLESLRGRRLGAFLKLSGGEPLGEPSKCQLPDVRITTPSTPGRRRYRIRRKPPRGALLD
jgi:hypothetical protein